MPSVSEIERLAIASLSLSLSLSQTHAPTPIHVHTHALSIFLIQAISSLSPASAENEKATIFHLKICIGF